MYTLNCKGKLLVIDKPIVMGIINATPDSFFAASRHQALDDALKTAERMLQDGAAILDIGGQSTRPAIISIDTYHSTTAEAAVGAGASIVNDISGGSFDPRMLAVVAGLRVPYVCMHLKGDPGTMHQNAGYQNLVQELLDYFIRKLENCRQLGIHDVIIDPGFGFSKNIEQNFMLLKQLDSFSILQRPILLGISRKSTIYKTLGVTAAEALNGTTVLHTAGLLKGAAILRAHDVKEAMEAITLTRYLV
jgi:dihydropteroate synthase